MGVDWKEKKTLDGMFYYHNTASGEISWEKPDALKSKVEIEESKGDWTWVPHEYKLWQPARKVAVEGNGDVQCVTEDGKNVVVPKSGVMTIAGREQKVPLWELSKASLKMLEEDLVMADGINEGMISHTLRERYQKDELYTWVGAGRSVLVSVNPYKRLPLYTKEVMDIHYKKTPNKPLPPHPFGIAVDSYESLLVDGGDQSILISGESGAGKTEATKQCLSFLAEIAGSESSVETKILKANPLLEAFGNAKTIRNNNSSRFGKWIEVHFDSSTRSICGAKILNYLLEKSRVVYQQKGERNYHIFYQMCQDSSLANKYDLRGDFHYTNQSGITKTPDVDDAGDLNELHGALEELSFSPEEKDWIFKTTAAVLHLGNVRFVSKAEKGSVTGSSIKDKSSLKTAARFLGVSESELERVLCYRSIAVRNEKNVIPLDPETARDGCDSLAKGIYGRMFDFLVKRVNESLQGRDGKFIGILDIFGFEIFENNSFEQLCINFANEKLQQQFNRTTFKEEEALYKSEGIAFKHIEFIDNQVVLDLIEKKPVGILHMLDEESLVPEGNNEKFMSKLQQRHASNPKFQTDKHRKLNNKLAFELCHYAGVVQYDSQQFMEKNKDTLYLDMYTVCGDSNDDLTKGLFPDQGTRRQLKSLSHQFRGQLTNLMDSLYKTESRYIRCVKPNNKQVPDRFETDLVVEQLRYSGVFEAVQIRKQGYPFRLNYRQFACRYKCINTDHSYRANKNDDRAVTEEIMKVAKQNFDEVQMGKTRVLYRAKEHKVLLLLRNLALETIVPVCQKIIRAGIAKEFHRRLDKATKELENALSVGNDITLMDSAIKAVPDTIGPLAVLFKQQPVNLQKAINAREKLQLWVDLEEVFQRLTKVRKPSKDELKELQQAVAKASDLLDIPRTKKQIKLFDVARSQVIYMEIKINEEHLDKNGDRYISIRTFRGLRDPKEFSKKKLFGKKKLEEGMCFWSKAKIPTALTSIQDKNIDKIATKTHAALMAYMGDKKHQQPNEMGSEVIGNAIQYSELRDEVFCQIIKQTEQNPDQQSAQKAWDLLSVAVSSFMPSSEFENYLLMHFRKANSPSTQQFVSAYHNTKYGKKPSNPPSPGTIGTVIDNFKACTDRSRFSVMPATTD
mmetsp:Transcript_1433/g.1965  ORF Transcript_1433/g.1965 Transcript_1433/m.1965 type:complete len:1132 (-) Transcript_1433:28-3423(-)